MKKFVGGLLAVAFVSPVFATSVMPPVALTENNMAVNAFVALQASGKNKDLQNQIDQLKKNGLVRAGKSEAALLGAQCGFAGCDSMFLATSSYATRGANTTTAVVAAIVHVNSYRNLSEVRRILTEKQIEALAHD